MKNESFNGSDSWTNHASNLTEEEASKLARYFQCIRASVNVIKTSSDPEEITLSLKRIIKSIDYILPYDEDALNQVGMTKAKLPELRATAVQKYKEMGTKAASQASPSTPVQVSHNSDFHKSQNKHTQKKEKSFGQKIIQFFLKLVFWYLTLAFVGGIIACLVNGSIIGALFAALFVTLIIPVDRWQNKIHRFVKGKVKACTAVVLALLCFISLGISVGKDSGQTESPAMKEEIQADDFLETVSTDKDDGQVVCDVTKYANISSAELIALLGEPDDKTETTPTAGYVEIPCTYFDYYDTDELGEVSFVLINDTVVKFTAYNEFPFYKNKNDLLESLNITKSDNCAMVIDTETALRFRCATDEIDDLWVTNIEDKTYGFLAITYDMIYFEEWYLPMSTSEETQYQVWTQDYVKSILKAPKSADFPNILKWAIAKNKFYIATQSYVDAINSFGAEIRSDFTFIYPVGSSTPIFAVFDSEVIVDNGYISTADLVEQLVAEMATEKRSQVSIENTEPNIFTVETEANEEPNYYEIAETSEAATESKIFITEDMNEFLVHYILPQYVSVQGNLNNAIEYDSNESTDWCYKLVGSVGNDKYEAMVYPFQQGKGFEITDLWVRYLYWNGELIIENASSEQVNYRPKKYW